MTLGPTVVAVLLAGGLADDFESGTLVSVDGGQAQWDGLRTFNPGVTLRASPLAAHRGQLGLRLVDNSLLTDGGCDPEAWVVRFLGDAGGDLYLRYWVRQQFSGIGSVEIDFVGFSPDGGDNGSSGTAFRSPGGGLQTGGYDTVRFVGATVDAGLPAGEWHLVELATTGLDTTDGGRTLRVDGREAGGSRGLDFTELSFNFVAVGENYACPTSTIGTVDFDDVRASATPHATWLAASGPASTVQGACAVVALALTDVTGAPAPAPYDVEVSLAGAPLSLFDDEGCATPAAALIIPSGNTRATHGVAVIASGTFTATPFHADFLTGATFTVQASPSASSRFNVGCACEAAPAGLPVACVVFCAFVRRRRPVVPSSLHTGNR